MKKTLATIVVGLMALLFAAPGASAQLRFGIKAGLDVDRLSFNQAILDSENRAGFTGGVMMEFTVPLIGVGCDLSAMYVRRNSRFMEAGGIVANNRDYFEIPLNLKYKLNLPGISRIVAPFVTTGPSVAFLTSRKHVSAALHNKAVDAAWNFGFGVELLRHVQVAASYGLGLSRSIESLASINGTEIQGKNRYWTVTAAYLF